MLGAVVECPVQADRGLVAGDGSRVPAESLVGVSEAVQCRQMIV